MFICSEKGSTRKEDITSREVVEDEIDTGREVVEDESDTGREVVEDESDVAQIWVPLGLTWPGPDCRREGPAQL